MSKLRTLLSIGQLLSGQLMKFELSKYEEIEIVGESNNAIDILALISRSKPHLWIHSWEDGPDLISLLTHAHAISPELVIVRVHPDEPFGMLQVPVNSFANLITKAFQLRQLVEVYAGSSYQAVS